jgi:hypothetical protein
VRTGARVVCFRGVEVWCWGEKIGSRLLLYPPTEPLFRALLELFSVLLFVFVFGFVFAFVSVMRIKIIFTYTRFCFWDSTAVIRRSIPLERREEGNKAKREDMIWPAQWRLRRLLGGAATGTRIHDIICPAYPPSLLNCRFYFGCQVVPILYTHKSQLSISTSILSGASFV